MSRELHNGDRITGRVVKLMPFGAFIAIAETDLVGLVKIPEISWQPISHPGDVLSLNQVIEAEILWIDRDNGQISLSIKRCQPE
ncbi:MAG: S1 RNA-binding domain-containing protein [Anaerolineae bacterium]|nr:S1 RNA-binding domain-containing protein [Anaerolineae bacterium]